ncbi:hypothetical protein [Streptomyces zaomyceticus]|uniref:hypothetical protein n=1 Tax=Streptomyces zaomyceticus TaxID=68286 RepID=UPI0033AA39E5
MEENESSTDVRDFDDTESEAIQLLTKFKISLLRAKDEFVAFTPHEKMTSRREVSTSSYGVSVSRDSLRDLRNQLQSGVVPHSTLRGIIAPSAGYAEVLLLDSRMTGSAAFRIRKSGVSDETPCSHFDGEGRVPSLRRENHVYPDLHIAGIDDCIEISPVSPACHVLTSLGRPTVSGDRFPYSFGISVKVYLGRTAPDRVEREAGELISSLLYELDVRNGIRFNVDRWFSERGDRSALRRKAATNVIRFPEISIKPEMATLFRFAASALDNPPLSFLSYYQILEHYLTSAVKRRALRKIAKEISDPLFNKSRRDDLLRIFMIGERSTHMSEAAQLRTLVEECVRPEALVDFFGSGNHQSHFGRKGPIAGVGTVNPENTQVSLPSQVADRVYGIRNRIVHAKDDPRFGEAPPLLPEGAEADALWPDITLVRLLATEVILDGHAGT